MNRFHAAAARVELKPAVGTRLTGFANRLDPSTGSHDALMAKLLLLDDGTTRLAWVSCDLIGLSVTDAGTLRRLLADHLAMPAANVLVSCTHTHSGPSSMSFRGELAKVCERWLARAFGAIIDAAAALPARLRPARLAHGTEAAPGLGYNRQDPASPIDERLLVAQLSRADDGQVIATLLNYATHPVVLGERNLSFSADYPGYATAAVEQAVGGVAMFVLGSAGDVDPVVYRDHGRHAGTFEVAKQMGRRLATAAATAIDRAEPRADARISIAEQRVDVPLDPPPSKQELARLKSEFLARRGPSDVLPTTNEGMWAMFELAWAEDLERALELDSVPSALPVQMTAARIGELYAVTFPFEIYSQIGLDVRRRMEPRDVVIAGYTNGLIGYVPTDRAKDQGGYGPTYSHRFFPDLLTAVGRGADETLVTAAMNLLRTLEG